MASALELSVPGSALTPALFRVVGRRRETDDVVTLLLESLDAARPAFRSGQFNMLSAFGVGEVAISVSGSPNDSGPLRHTVRDVGAVTHALCSSDVGDIVGVRGPFGTDWGVTGSDDLRRLRHRRRRYRTRAASRGDRRVDCSPKQGFWTGVRAGGRSRAGPAGVLRRSSRVGGRGRGCPHHGRPTRAGLGRSSWVGDNAARQCGL